MINNQLKHVLVDHNMSIRQLAQNIGVTYSMVYDFANMRRNSVQFDLLNAICNELNVTPGQLLTYSPGNQD